MSKICKKCDVLETNDNNDYCGICANELVADLEAKLAESEKKFVVANNLRKNSDEVLLNYKTEKYGLDKTIQELRKIKLSFPEKEYYYKGFENCERQMSSHIADLTLEVKELKQQLAEKENEKIEYTDTINFVETSEPDIVANELDRLNQQLAEKEGFIEDLMTGRLKPAIPRIKEIEKHHQDKISFAVEKLEKVKEFNHSLVLGGNYKLDEYIDNQIEELKKEMK